MSIDSIVGLIAPNICVGCGVEGFVLCDNCMISAGEPTQPRCVGCKKLSDDYRTCNSCKSWIEIYSVHVATEYEGIYEQLIHELKFEMKRQAAIPISKMMASVTPDFTEEIIICCIPTAPARIRQRGFDHAKLILKNYKNLLAKNSSKPQYEFPSLLGRKTSNRQLGSSRAKRIEQMENEFFVKDNQNIEGKTVLLIDDVVTTGATIAGAARTLKLAGAKRVYAVIFAQKA